MGRKIILISIFVVLLSTTTQAGILDFIKYKKVKFLNGPTVLVDRRTDKVKYYWVNDQWVSTSITPEIERLFQFRYEQTKAPKPLFPKKEKTGRNLLPKKEKTGFIPDETVKRYRARYPSNNNMSITEIISKLRVTCPTYSHLSDEELLDTLSRW